VIDRSGSVWLYEIPDHKMEHYGSARIIPIGPKGQQVLQPYLDRPADQPCFSPAEAEQQRREAKHARRKTPLQYGNRPGTNRKHRPQRSAGDRYTRDSYRRCITRACSKAKIDRWHPNQLRHTRATEVRQQAGLEAAQCVLGHSNAQVSQIYALRNLQLAISVAQQTG
jgi:integrase